MKFVLVLAALVAVAFAVPSESSGTLDAEKLQEALIIAGMNPEEAHGFMDFIRSAGRVIRDKVLPAATKILPDRYPDCRSFWKRSKRDVR
ncbi:hypothetical protein pipiens_001420 [Culex pipiens pipiens]|uniref:Uncharacterized protein n=1 Tax=Culex pipiens pipiens TaxID=38569 RepID=A0ABD1CUX9_CULPP